jgi:hypothetical protein
MAHMERINWDLFPEPYNRELPFYIDKAFQRLSPGGVEILNEVVEVHADMSSLNPDAPSDEVRKAKSERRRERWSSDAFFERMQALPEWDQSAIFALADHFKKATEALIEHNESWQGLMRQALVVMEKAAELTGRDLETMTTGEAVEILKRHGEPLGFSEEVLEMEVEISPDEDEDEPST